MNLTNYETIEFRLFRGTLRYQTFIATLDLVSHICYLASQLSDEDFEKMSWLDFVLTIDADEIPELIRYMFLINVQEEISAKGPAQTPR